MNHSDQTKMPVYVFTRYVLIGFVSAFQELLLAHMQKHAEEGKEAEP